MWKMLVALALAVTPVAAEESRAVPKGEEAVKAVFVKLYQCLAARNANCAVDLCVDDVTVLPPIGPGKILKGKRETVALLEAELQKLPKSAVLKFEPVVQNVRFIGAEHALADCVVGEEPVWGAPPGTPPNARYSTALFTRRGDKWMIQDMRAYLVHRVVPPAPPTVGPEPKSSPPAAASPNPSAAAPGPPATPSGPTPAAPEKVPPAANP